MNLSCPARTVVPTLAAEVLLVLAGTTMPLTGRQVHALLRDGSQKGVSLVLGRLAASGLVDTSPAGPALLYSLNRDHVAAEAVLALVDLRGKLFERIRQHLAGWTVPPVAAAVFGSAARGDGDLESDIDLFVVRPAGVADDDPSWSADVAGLRELVHRWSGNPCSLIQATPAQVRAMVERGEPIVAELRRDAVSLVAGSVLEVRP